MWILRPIRLEHSKSTRQFIFRILAQMFTVKIVVGVVFGSLLPDASFDDHSELFQTPGLAFVLVVLVAPVVETLLTQTLPIETVRAFRRSWLPQFLAGSVLFAALHFFGGVATGIAAGTVGGVFFSYTYLECRARSWLTAVWVTAVVHGLHNVVALPFAFMLSD